MQRPWIFQRQSHHRRVKKAGEKLKLQLSSIASTFDILMGSSGAKLLSLTFGTLLWNGT